MDFDFFFLSKLKFYLMIVIFFLIKILQINLLSKNEMQFIKRGNGKIDTKEYFFFKSCNPNFLLYYFFFV